MSPEMQTRLWPGDHSTAALITRDHSLPDRDPSSACHTKQQLVYCKRTIAGFLPYETRQILRGFVIIRVTG